MHAQDGNKDKTVPINQQFMATNQSRVGLLIPIATIISGAYCKIPKF
jgi:hypothetical protein